MLSAAGGGGAALGSYDGVLPGTSRGARLLSASLIPALPAEAASRASLPRSAGESRCPGALTAQGKAAPERSSLSPGGFPFPPLARGLLEGQSHLRCRLRVGLVGFSGLELALGKATQ